MFWLQLPPPHEQLPPFAIRKANGFSQDMGCFFPLNTHSQFRTAGHCLLRLRLHQCCELSTLNAANYHVVRNSSPLFLSKEWTLLWINFVIKPSLHSSRSPQWGWSNKCHFIRMFPRPFRFWVLQATTRHFLSSGYHWTSCSKIQTRPAKHLVCRRLRHLCQKCC